MDQNDLTFDDFRTFLENEPLVETNGMVTEIQETLFQGTKRSIFYGIGLCTPKELSIGLPFDILEMIFVAERIRRSFNFERIYQHIADTHAKTNQLFNKKTIDQTAKKTKVQLEQIFRNFGFSDFVICTASDFDSTNEYRKIYDELPKKDHEYIVREIADICWYSLKYNSKLKLGWFINTGGDSKIGNDETLFDRKYNGLFPNSMSFIYLKPGRTFDKSRQRVSPYIFLKNENRLILKKGENVEEKFSKAEIEWGDKYFGGARKHLENIVHAYEKLFGNLLGMSIEEKIQYILDRAVA